MRGLEFGYYAVGALYGATCSTMRARKGADGGKAAGRVGREDARR
jgi:hypothetical protein